MKNLLLISILMFLPMAALFAGHPYESYNHTRSVLEIDMGQFHELTVTIGNKNFYLRGGRIVVRDLEPGYHFIQITEHLRNRTSHMPHHEQRIIFEGEIYIDGGMKVFARMDRYNGFKIISEHPLNRNNSHCKSGYGDYNDRDYDYYNGSRGRYYDHVGRDEFRIILRTVSDRWFDSSRKEAARQIIQSRPLNSVQIRAIIDLFDFESSKLSIAKFGYDYVTDPQKYYMVFDAFDFESSVRKLSDYIDRRR